VRVDVFKRWLSRDDKVDESSDIEGELTVDADESIPSEPIERLALRWKGPESKETSVIKSPTEVWPGDLYVLPITGDVNLPCLGDFPNGSPTDQGDEAFQRARDRAILRLTPTLLDIPSLRELSESDDLDETLCEAIASLKTDSRQFVRNAARSLEKKSHRFAPIPHPLGGFVITGRTRLHQFDPTFRFDSTFVEAEESSESASDQPVVLADHCRDVAECARRFADGVGLTKEQVYALELAGRLHDGGKADPRFQAWLHKGNRRVADLFPHRLAKSLAPMQSMWDRQLARQRAGYPKNSRHELLSVRLAESDGVLPADGSARELILHLIASHHGYCRPFAPVVEDPEPEIVAFVDTDRTLKASSATGLERLDSGVAERFWKLTRRFGWWGLPWLESLLRLADWSASEAATHTERSHE
jgi:CRISPR-associated endonuclease/helicase Cas3